jgi:hypothetical protein
MPGSRVARFFLVLNSKTGDKIYQITTKYNKWALIISNGRKIDQKNKMHQHARLSEKYPNSDFLV